MPNKVKIARFCLLVAGWLKIATAGLFAFILVAGAVVVGGNSERSGLLGSALLGGLGVILAAAFVAAGGVKRRAGWGRVLGIVVGALLVALVPVGTVLGLFVVSGLLGADAREWFSGGQGRF
jgi:hypothetical protein